MPKPTIAALPGPAAGAGMSLALACDLRYATTNAFLTTAFARVALAGDYGGAWFLTRLVGAGKARELLYFSDRVGAEEAAGLGLVNDVFPEDAFEAEVRARARRLAETVAAVAPPAVDPALVETNIVVVQTDAGPGVVARAMAEGVLLSLLDPTHLRAVTHLDVDDAAVGLGAEVLAALLAD